MVVLPAPPSGGYRYWVGGWEWWYYLPLPQEDTGLGGWYYLPLPQEDIGVGGWYYLPLPQEDIDGGGEDAGSKRVESDVHGL